MCESVQELREGLAGWSDRFDPARLSAVECAAVLTDVVAIKNMAATVEALAAARVAETTVWRARGAKTAAEWLARSTGTTANHAKDAIATGQRLEGLDGVAAAARHGRLSPQQTSAIADAATADPSAETELVNAAGTESLGELRDRCQRVKAAADPDPAATHARLRKRRSTRTYCDGEGAWNLHARNTPEAGAEITSVLDDLTDEIFQAAYTAGHREARDAYAADALLEMARRARDGAAVDDKKRRRHLRFLAIIRADLDALVRGTVDNGEVCEIAGFGPIPVSVARSLLGDSILKLVLTKGADVANVTHLGRGPTAAQKIALLWSQPLCEVEGCGRRARLEADHLQPWRDVHHTRLDELGHKCDHHHDLKSNHGWDLVPGVGKRPMVPPDDPRHPRHRPPPPDEAPTSSGGDDHPAQTHLDVGNSDAA